MKHDINIVGMLLLSVANMIGSMIRVKEPTKMALDALKVIPEEPYDKVVQRLLAFFKEHQREVRA